MNGNKALNYTVDPRYQAVEHNQSMPVNPYSAHPTTLSSENRAENYPNYYGHNLSNADHYNAYDSSAPAPLGYLTYRSQAQSMDYNSCLNQPMGTTQTGYINYQYTPQESQFPPTNSCTQRLKPNISPAYSTNPQKNKIDNCATANSDVNVDAEPVVIRKHEPGCCSFFNPNGLFDEDRLLGWLNFWGCFDRERLTYHTKHGSIGSSLAVRHVDKGLC